MPELTNYPLVFPAGLYRNGTQYQARGRWADAQLIRFFEGAKRPLGGWEALQANTGTGSTELAAGTPAVDNAITAGFTPTGGATNHAVTNKTSVNDTTYAHAATSSLTTLVLALDLSDIGVITGTSVKLKVRLKGTGALGPVTVSLNKTTDDTLLWSTVLVPFASFITTDITVDTSLINTDHANLTCKVSAMVTIAVASVLDVTWIRLSSFALTPEDIDVSPSGGSVIRKLFAWRDASGVPYLAIGTNTSIYTFVQGALTDRTPGDFDAGTVDTESDIGGYGNGAYGLFNYGEGDPTQEVIVEAGSWQLDAFGGYLVGVATSDGRALYWDGLTDDLVEMTDAPTNNSAIIVTNERFVFLLGADGDPRSVAWPSRETLDDWTPSSSNTAGSFPLPGTGQLMCGMRGKNETLLFTDDGLFSAQYIGGSLVYAFTEIGSKCGIVSRHAAAVIGQRCVWMGQRGFYQYDGSVRELPSEVSDYIFADFNRTQAAKVVSMATAMFGEVTWHYCSAASTEPDRYVTWNSIENHWSTGTLTRTAGIDNGVFTYPMRAKLGNIYNHENGTSHTDIDTSVTAPFLESGPLELGNGETVAKVLRLIPDEATRAGQQVGSLNLTLYSALYPDADEATNGPYTIANPTDVRVTARQVRARFDEVVAGDWRLGDVRLGAVAGGRR